MEAFLQLDHKKSRLIIWGTDEPDTNYQYINIEYRKHVRDDEINDILGQIDVLVFPSIWEEIFGLIGIECRTARVPVIGSNIGGIPEWLKDGESGFLVPPNDPEALAAMMERFVRNPALIAEIQRDTKPWKSFDDHIGELIDLYTTLIGEKSQT
jgi:glycosyltransferase involved in cell wall biosynthesis